MNILKYYKRVRSHTLELCRPLRVEDFVVQIATFTSPAKWQLGHVTWFFEEFILKTYSNKYIQFDENFNFLFNSYYNNAGQRVARAKRGSLSRPTLDEIYNYMAYVDRAMIELLTNNHKNKFLQLVILGLNHEEQHQELLLTDIKYMLGHNPLFPSYNKKTNLVNSINKTSNFVTIEEDVYTIGYQGKGFCYDNELGVHKVYINSFKIANFLVTNEEFIEFIEAGGYEDYNLWLEKGLHWIKNEKIKAPLYWHKIDNQWYYYTLSGLQKINPKSVLSHISFYEAAAFAQSKNMRLPTEFEWEVASKKLAWGERWEWTSSAYLPYPNYKKVKGAVGEYNGKFMNNQMVLRGSSVATSKNHSRKSYRNFFYSNECWQFTGIRLVKI